MRGRGVVRAPAARPLPRGPCRRGDGDDGQKEAKGKSDEKLWAAQLASALRQPPLCRRRPSRRRPPAAVGVGVQRQAPSVHGVQERREDGPGGAQLVPAQGGKGGCGVRHRGEGGLREVDRDGRQGRTQKRAALRLPACKQSAVQAGGWVDGRTDGHAPAVCNGETGARTYLHNKVQALSTRGSSAPSWQAGERAGRRAGGGSHLRTKCCWSPRIASRMRRGYASGMATPG